MRQRTDFRFTTLAFCIVDFSADPPRLYVACGGHPRPLVLRPDGSVEAVGGMGPLLGVVANAEFRQDEAELEAGDVIVLYTDGLTDALAPEKMLSEDELIAALASCRGSSAGEVSRELERVALGDDPQRVPRDDIALVVARVS